MALNDYKILDADFASKDIASLSDRPSADGLGANALKERFDAGAKLVIAPKINALIDELASVNGATGIGVTTIAGLAGYNIQSVLVAIKTLLDAKKDTSISDNEMALKFDSADAQGLVQDVQVDLATGVITVVKYDGTTATFDTALEKVALDVRLDGQEFVLTLADGTEQRVNLSAFLTETEVANTDTINLSIENNAIVARVVSKSIKLSHLADEVTTYINEKAASAATFASNAQASAENAEASYRDALACKEDACNCASSASASEVNSAENARIAGQSAEDAASSAEIAQQAVSDAAIIVSGGTVIMHENGTAYQLAMDDTSLYLVPVQSTTIASFSLGGEDTGYYVETNTGTYNLQNVEETEAELDAGEYNFDLI